MGRWTQYDEDEYRLPEGMKRVGYDADTQTYQYRSSDGTLWEGPEGAQYGQLKRASGPVSHVEAQDDDEDIEAAPTRGDGYQPLANDADGNSSRLRASNAAAYRTLFPFLMIIMVVLLLVIRLAMHSGDPGQPEVALCTGDNRPYRLKSGDTCWALSKEGGFSVDDLRATNPGLDCDKLTPTQIICLPPVQ
ncbi:hypothetical protein K474DRAFT_1586024 [Panus rudis PR-1116 ss-1]|nr:hypothetical protein K474DRAFT_1586024 [Panus rudis PR-1116 ss-1]